MMGQARDTRLHPSAAPYPGRRWIQAILVTFNFDQCKVQCDMSPYAGLWSGLNGGLGTSTVTRRGIETFRSGRVYHP